LGLHSADPGEGREFLQQVAEEVAAAPAFENLVHRLEGHVFVQVFFVAGVADASDLRATDNGQQVEFVEGAGSFRKRKAEPLPQCAFGQIHLENRKQAEGHAPRLKPQRHRHRDRARGRSVVRVSKCAAALAATIE
jgi:hypothetical protein